MKILAHEDEEADLGKQVLKNVRDILCQIKTARDNTTLTFRNAVVASVSGENVSCKVKLSNKRSFNAKKCMVLKNSELQFLHRKDQHLN